MSFTKRPKLFSIYGLLSTVACLLGAGCDNGSKCSDEERVAIEVHLTVPEGLKISKVTAELESEQNCGFFDQGRGPVYTCWEQGGGTYKLRVYSGADVIYSEDDEVASDGCHITELYVTEIDLTDL